jgi:hypothetical protein
MDTNRLNDREWLQEAAKLKQLNSRITSAQDVKNWYKNLTTFNQQLKTEKLILESIADIRFKTVSDHIAEMSTDNNDGIIDVDELYTSIKNKDAFKVPFSLSKLRLLAMLDDLVNTGKLKKKLDTGQFLLV